MGTARAQIIRDTRESEKHGWKFNKSLPGGLIITSICDDTLLHGDYSMAGYDLPSDDDSVIIERKKSIMELCGNFGKNWTRFNKVLEGLAQYAHPLIIVEDDFHNIYARSKAHKYITLSPDFLLKRISFIYSEYRIPVLFLSNAYNSQRFVAGIFKNLIDKHE
jgi:ERCC4-type nuclease